MKQVHVFMSGSVQGVGYRYFVYTEAQKVGLTGWVRNTDDGRVEAVFQGEEKVIETMIELCRQGPQMADVKQIDVEWKDMQESFDEFFIR